MTPLCIYQHNQGLGPCGGPVCRITVASKATRAWRGLHDLADRLAPSGEAPGVCQAHAPRAEANGFLIGVEAPAPPPRPRRAQSPRRPKGAGTPKPSVATRRR